MAPARDGRGVTAMDERIEETATDEEERNVHGQDGEDGREGRQEDLQLEYCGGTSA